MLKSLYLNEEARQRLRAEDGRPASKELDVVSVLYLCNDPQACVSGDGAAHHLQRCYITSQMHRGTCDLTSRAIDWGLPASVK